MVLQGLPDGVHDEIVHIHLVLSVHGESAMVRVLGICPGLMEYELRRAEALHIFDKLRQVGIVRGVEAGDAAGLLEAHIGPFFLLESLGNTDSVPLSGFPVHNLAVAVFRGIGLYVVVMPFQRASADVQIADDRRYSGRVQKLPEVVFDGVLGEGIAYGQDLQRVRSMEVADVLYGLVGLPVKAYCPYSEQEC